jgi:alkylation response protein AidB-like acyl-CoA dehydrogenase
MNFDFTTEDRALFEAVRQAAAGREGLPELLPALAYTGYLNPELSGTTLMGAMEALASLDPALFLGVEMSARLLGRALARWGSPAQRARWGAPLAQGTWIGALALSEQGMNVDNEPLATQARREGDGVRLEGAKSYVVNAPVADWIGVVGRLEDRPALFMVARDAPGLTVEAALRTLGTDGLPIAGLTLAAVRLPAAQVVLLTDDHLEVLRLWENQVLIAAALGMQAAALAQARDYAKAHRTGGRPIIAYQEVGFKLAEMLTLHQTSQLYAYRAAWAADRNAKEAQGLTWCAKVFCTEAAERVAGEALRILGGAGYQSGGAAEQAYRSAKYPQIAGTSTEIARVKIGDEALGYLN